LSAIVWTTADGRGRRESATSGCADKRGEQQAASRKTRDRKRRGRLMAEKKWAEKWEEKFLTASWTMGRREDVNQKSVPAFLLSSFTLWKSVKAVICGCSAVYFSAHHLAASLNMNREGGKTRTEHRTPNIQHRTSKDGVAVIEQGRREGARRANIEHRTSLHRASNIEHPISKGSRTGIFAVCATSPNRHVQGLERERSGFSRVWKAARCRQQSTDKLRGDGGWH